MDRKCARKIACQTSVYKHFNPKCERDISPVLPTILPKNDDEVKKPIRRSSYNKKPTVQKNRSQHKSATDTNLTKKTIDIKLPVSSGTKKSDVTNTLISRTDPCTLHNATTSSYSPSDKRVYPSQCTIDDCNSRISYNLENIKLRNSCRVSLQDEPVEKEKATAICEKITKCILDRIDNCRLSNLISSKYVDGLKNEIKEFASPKCSKFDENLENLKQEISDFRKSKDEKYNAFSKKLELLKAPPCDNQPKDSSPKNKMIVTQIQPKQTQIPKGKVLTRSKYYMQKLSNNFCNIF